MMVFEFMIFIGSNTVETSAEYFTARRLVKRAVKQAKRNEEINVARLCKTNPKGFYSYINERRRTRDNEITSQNNHWPNCHLTGQHSQHILQFSVHPGTTEHHSTAPQICRQCT